MKLSFLHSMMAIVLAMTFLHTTDASAKLYMGKISLKVGETYTAVAVPATSGYTASGYWTKTGTSFAFTSTGNYNCTIRANYVGSGTLSYWGSVARSGAWTTDIYDLYWDIEVEGDNNSSDSGSTGGESGTDTPTTPSDSWANSGNYSISWYNKSQTEFTLSTNKELAGLAYLLNIGYNLDGISIKLGADIDLSGKEWTPCSFIGSFDGQGHTIEGIEISTFKEKQSDFGFFSELGANSSVRNTVFKGFINVKGINTTSSDWQEFRIGGIAGNSNATIENCRCEIPITFGIENSKYSHLLEIYVGGIFGVSGTRSKIINCSHFGDIMYDSNDYLGYLYLGGLVGYCSGNISRSEHLSDIIGMSSAGILGATDKIIYIAGIAGYHRQGSNGYCRSIINKIVINSTKSVTYLCDFYVSGISSYKPSSGNDVNCYSSVSKIETSSYIDNSLIYYNYQGKGCFRNSDMVTVGKNASSSDYSTSFTSSQMMTPAFLEELNLYPLLETDEGRVWTQDIDGGYPYIAELYPTSDVKSLKSDKTVSKQSVFTISGQRLEKPRKGINIINGRKVVVK